MLFLHHVSSLGIERSRRHVNLNEGYIVVGECMPSIDLIEANYGDLEQYANGDNEASEIAAALLEYYDESVSVNESKSTSEPSITA